MRATPAHYGWAALVSISALAWWAGSAWGGAPVRESEAAQRPTPEANPPTVNAANASPEAEPLPTNGTGINALYYQLQVLQDDVRRLQGIVEEQNYRIERLTKEQRERYIELDQRLVELRQSPGAGAGATAAPAPASAQTERGLYNAAYALVKQVTGRPASERKDAYEQALAMFTELIDTYPNGSFTPNAFYWTGEIHVYTDELELARQAFVQVVNLFSDHDKVPDALYKLGVVYHRLGDNASALRYLDRVAAEHPGHTAASLARSYAAELR